MKQAMAACGTKLVGTGTAKANLAPPGDIGGCVLAFNALDANPNVAGNQPGILLFTRLQMPGRDQLRQPGQQPKRQRLDALAGAAGRPTPRRPLRVERSPAAYYQGGKWLDFNNIPQTRP